MRKKLIHCQGVLALVLGASPAVGQEKPAVLPPKPVLEVARDFKVDSHTRGEEIAFFRLADGRTVFAADGVLVEARFSQPLMKGDLAVAVEEMEKAVQVIGEADLLEGLAALETAERAVMMARRLLPAHEEAAEESSEVAGESYSSRLITFTSSRDGTVRRWLMSSGEEPVLQGPVRAQLEDRTALQEAQDSLRGAIASLRHAGDAEQATMALDGVEKSVTALRVLFWEKQAAENR